MGDVINLNGLWDVSVDTAINEDEGLVLSDNCSKVPWMKTNVPGCWEKEGASKLLAGPVWYRKEFHLGRRADSSRWILKFERVSYYCDVYVNGQYAGSHEGMWDSFYFDVTGLTKDGSSNVIMVRVYKSGYKSEDRFRYRETITGFIPDVASTFGGIWGSVSIAEKPPVFIEHGYVEPDVANKRAKAFIFICNTKQYKANVKIKGSIPLAGGREVSASKEVPLTPGEVTRAVLEFELDDFVLWDMDNPYLYKAFISVSEGEVEVDSLTKRFGMREIRAEGKRILLNGTPLYIRGILHWGYYPKTICPIPDNDEIAGEITKAKDMGFNLIKHCLYVPSDEYYELADELGVLLWQELPVWLPVVTNEFIRRIREQYPKILKSLGGHPSGIIYTLGCEMNADMGTGILEELYNMVKEESGGLLVRDNSGSGECYGGHAVDFADFYDYHFYSDLQNIENLMEVFTPGWRDERPWLYGEFCDFDTFRDVRELKNRLKESELWWLSEKPEDNPLSQVVKMPVINQQEALESSNLGDDTRLLKEISYKSALLHRKYTIEAVRQFPEIGGYVITAIRDVPISTSGIFDDFMNLKFDSSDFKMFNNDVVLSLAWDLSRAWINGGDRVFLKDRYNYFSGDEAGVRIVVSNFSTRSIVNPEIGWNIKDEDGNIIASGSACTFKTVDAGRVCEVYAVRFKTPEVQKACRLTIDVCVRDKDTFINNGWSIWAYPGNVTDTSDSTIALHDPFGILDYIKSRYNLRSIPGEIHGSGTDMVITTQMTEEIEKYLQDGGKVFYVQRGEGYLPVEKCPFWRESVKRVYNHGIMDGFPHGGYTDLQFFGLATDTAIDSFKLNNVKYMRPVIRRVDARKFTVSDYMAEIGMGKGVMVASTLRFEGGMGKQPSMFKYNKAGLYIIDRVIRYLLNG